MYDLTLIEYFSWFQVFIFEIYTFLSLELGKEEIVRIKQAKITPIKDQSGFSRRIQDNSKNNNLNSKGLVFCYHLN